MLNIFPVMLNIFPVTLNIFPMMLNIHPVILKAKRPDFEPILRFYRLNEREERLKLYHRRLQSIRHLLMAKAKL